MLEELSNWFSPEELQPCPRCGTRKLLPTSGDWEPTCLRCGPLAWPRQDLPAGQFGEGGRVAG